MQRVSGPPSPRIPEEQRTPQSGQGASPITRQDLVDILGVEGRRTLKSDNRFNRFVSMLHDGGVQMNNPTEVRAAFKAFRLSEVKRLPEDMRAAQQVGFTPLTRAIADLDVLQILHLLKSGHDPFDTIKYPDKIKFGLGYFRNETSRYLEGDSEELVVKGLLELLPSLDVRAEYRPQSVGNNALTLAIVCDPTGEVVSTICMSMVAKAVAGDADATKLLNQPDGTGRTPLTTAIEAGKYECVEQLIQSGVDVCASDTLGTSPLGLAAFKGDTDILRLLLDDPRTRSVLDKPDGNGRTPLMMAAIGGSQPCVELLIQSGADLGVIDAAGASALSLAASGGNIEIARLLLDRGAEIGPRPLEAALRYGHAEVFALLNERGKSVDLHYYADPHSEKNLRRNLLQVFSPFEPTGTGRLTIVDRSINSFGNFANDYTRYAQGFPNAPRPSESFPEYMHEIIDASLREINKQFDDLSQGSGSTRKVGHNIGQFLILLRAYRDYRTVTTSPPPSDLFKLDNVNALIDEWRQKYSDVLSVRPQT